MGTWNLDSPLPPETYWDSEKKLSRKLRTSTVLIRKQTTKMQSVTNSLFTWKWKHAFLASWCKDGCKRQAAWWSTQKMEPEEECAGSSLNTIAGARVLCAAGTTHPTWREVTALCRKPLHKAYSLSLGFLAWPPWRV